MSGNQQQCPQCGQANRCGLSDRQNVEQACWCFALQIDPAIIAALPTTARGVACLCRRCAQTLPATTVHAS